MNTEILLSHVIRFRPSPPLLISRRDTKSMMMRSSVMGAGSELGVGMYEMNWLVIVGLSNSVH